MNAPERVFVIVGHKAAVTPDFTLSDLPGSAGRLDILARCVTTAFCLSHGIRADVEVYLVLRDEITVRFQGSRLKRLNPDERSTGALIQHALRALQEGKERRSTPGVTVAERGLRAVLQELEERGVRVYVLDEHGIDIREEQLPESLAFVLSDHVNFTAEELALLQRYEKISLGPTVLHADHCIAIVHNELDRREASRTLE
jgi:tRNA (pseudouridine54-N1)-methyltransferase